MWVACRPRVHRFSAIQRDLRDKFAASIETRDEWIEIDRIGEGESKSWRVRNVLDGMEGVAKPNGGACSMWWSSTPAAPARVSLVKRGQAAIAALALFRINRRSASSHVCCPRR